MSTSSSSSWTTDTQGRTANSSSISTYSLDDHNPLQAELLRHAGISTQYLKRLPGSGRFESVKLGRGSQQIYRGVASVRKFDQFFNIVSPFSESQDEVDRQNAARTMMGPPKQSTSIQPTPKGTKGALDLHDDVHTHADSSSVGNGNAPNSQTPNTIMAALVKQAVPSFEIQKRLRDPILGKAEIIVLPECTDYEQRPFGPPGQSISGTGRPKSYGNERYFTYEGSWKKGVMEGVGKFRFADGSRYEGSLANNRPNGQGTAEYQNGIRYSGAWVDGKFHGDGVLHYPSGGVYDGKFVGGKREGHGRLKYVRTLLPLHHPRTPFCALFKYLLVLCTLLYRVLYGAMLIESLRRSPSSRKLPQEGNANAKAGPALQPRLCSFLPQPLIRATSEF